jgi:hypothetical protein
VVRAKSLIINTRGKVFVLCKNLGEIVETYPQKKLEQPKTSKPAYYFITQSQDILFQQI